MMLTYEDLSLPKSRRENTKDLLLYLTRNEKTLNLPGGTSSLRFGGGFLYRINILKTIIKIKRSYKLQIRNFVEIRNKH